MKRGTVVFWVGIMLSIGWGADLQYDYLKEASLSDTGASIAKNPAMIVDETPHISFSRQDKLNALWQESSVYAVLPSSGWSLGLLANYDVIANIPQTSQANDGTFQTDSRFSHLKAGMILTLGTSLSPEMSVGVNSKLYYQKLAGRTCFNTGWDFGLQYTIFSNVKLGISLNDLGGTTFRWSDTVADTIPSHTNYTVAYQGENLSAGYLYRSVDHRSIVNASYRFYDVIEASVSIPTENPYQSRMSLSFHLSPMKIGCEIGSEDSAGQSASFHFSFDMGDPA